MTTTELGDEKIVELTYRIYVSSETYDYKDLVLEQLLRRLPEWFGDLSPIKISQILQSVAHDLLEKERQN